MVYKSIDIMKFVMALCVVTIHCATVDAIPVDILRQLGTAVISLAVPFFFVTSAFLLYRHMAFDEEGRLSNKEEFHQKQRHYLLHIAKMFLTWMTLYFCMTQNETFLQGPLEVAKAYIGQAVLWGSGYMWYLWGLLLVIPLISKLLSNVNRGGLVFIGFVLTCIFRFYSHYGSVEEPNWWQQPLVYLWQGHVVNINGFCYAWAYISVGAFMATTSRWKKLSNMQLGCIFAVSFLYSWFIDNGVVCVGLQPAAFALVALCMRWNIQRESPWFGRLRQLSTYVYLTHVFVIMFAYHTFGLSYSSLAQWLFCLVGSVVVAQVVIWTKTK